VKARVSYMNIMKINMFYTRHQFLISNAQNCLNLGFTNYKTQTKC
jgi:hypothetical protein